MSIIDELHQIFPWKNLEPSLIERLKNKISGYENGDSNEKAFNPQLILTLCGGDHDNLIKTSWMTTEKLLNTDEQCPFPTGEHLPPLTDIELETELNQYCPTLQRNDIQNILGKAFHVSITSHLSDQTVYHYLSFRVDIYSRRHSLVIHHYLQNCIQHRYLIKNTHH